MQSGEHWHQEGVPVPTPLTPWPPLISFLFLCIPFSQACSHLLSTADPSSVPSSARPPPELKTPDNANLFYTKTPTANCVFVLKNQTFTRRAKARHGASSTLPHTKQTGLKIAKDSFSLVP